MQCPICPKLHTFDKSHGLKTSCQCLSYRYSATCWLQEITCFKPNSTCNVQSAPNFMFFFNYWSEDIYQIFSSFIYIVPPAVTENSLFYSNSNMHCPLCTKLHKFGKIPGLKTSKDQYSDITIAPPIDKRMCQALH